MAIKITVISPAMEAHMTGCADIAKVLRRRGFNDETANEYEGETLLDAILDADQDLADWFCETPYQAGATHWAIASCDIKPCLGAAIAKAKIGFTHGDPVDGERPEGDGRPYVMDGPAPEPPTSGTGSCQCGCGGSPKGRKSRFLPGHDMRKGHGDRPAPSRVTETKEEATETKRTAPAPRLRCRAIGPSSSLVWSAQCRFPAKGTRDVPDYTQKRDDYTAIPMITIPVCGVHGNPDHRVPSVYRPRPESKYEQPVQEFMK